MEKYFILWVLFNYISSLTIIFISILQKWSFFIFLIMYLSLALGLNLTIYILSLIYKILQKSSRLEHVIDVVIPSETEQEMRDILKEASNLDENSEFKDWTPE